MAAYRKPSGGVLAVCAYCDAYIRATQWLAAHGRELSETAVYAAAQVVRTGTFVYDASPGASHMKSNVFHHLATLSQEGLLTKETASGSAKTRTVVTFRMAG